MSLFVVMLAFSSQFALPIFATSSVSDLFRLGRAVRIVLPLGNGTVLHLFVVNGLQDVERDPEKQSLTDELLTSVLRGAYL